MTLYEEQVYIELNRWARKLLKPPGIIERASKGVQRKINEVIPDKVHDIITTTVRGIVKSVLSGLDFIPKGPPLNGLTLEERDRRAKELLEVYKKVAAAEGAGTGAGGFLLAIADFPVLIAIKLRFLFELAQIYGYDTKQYTERIYILYIFQLTFSSQIKRPDLFKVIADWPKKASEYTTREKDIQQIDWEQFQQEYRDTIDFRKLLQMIPGIGAVIGAWANYGLLDDLGIVGINCYRLRILKETKLKLK